jgi:hypothetical protein
VVSDLRQITLKYYWNVSLGARGERDVTLSKFRILHAGFGVVDRRDLNLGRRTQWEMRQRPITAQDAPNRLQARNSPGGSVGRQRGKAKAPHHNYNPVKIVPYTATCGSLYPGGMQCGVYRTGGRNEG